MADFGRRGCDWGEFTSTVHGKPPELWLPLRLQRLRSRVLKITSYSAVNHPPTTLLRINSTPATCNRCLDAFVIGHNRFSILSLTGTFVPWCWNFFSCVRAKQVWILLQLFYDRCECYVELFQEFNQSTSIKAKSAIKKNWNYGVSK